MLLPVMIERLDQQILLDLDPLFGFDPDARRHQVDEAHEFEQALGFFANESWRQIMRGPRTPYRRMIEARKRLDRVIFSEIERRRSTGQRGEDVLSLLLDAKDDEGHGLAKRANRLDAYPAAIACLSRWLA